MELEMGLLGLNIKLKKAVNKHLETVKGISKKNRFYTQFRQEGDHLIPSPTIHLTEFIGPAFYDLRNYDDGLHLIPKSMETDNLLRLPDSASDSVIAQIEKFWTLKNTFSELGLVHKRGFLLHGPPGCGKTSCIAFLTSQMIDRGGVVLMGDTNPSLISHGMGAIREIKPELPIMVLMEDIDTIIEHYGESNVLSLLDGENSVENAVFVATTNYLNLLKPRVRNRPSRFDIVIEIGMPSADGRRMYLESKNLDFTPEELKRWVNSTTNFSIAHLKELIISVVAYGNDFDESVKRIREIGFINPNEDEDSDEDSADEIEPTASRPTGRNLSIEATAHSKG
jgi:hypothetical protein